MPISTREKKLTKKVQTIVVDGLITLCTSIIIFFHIIFNAQFVEYVAT